MHGSSLEITLTVPLRNEILIIFGNSFKFEIPIKYVLRVRDDAIRFLCVTHRHRTRGQARFRSLFMRIHMIKFINHEHVMGLRGAGAGWSVIENKFEGG